jgi:hypothetical protein
MWRKIDKSTPSFGELEPCYHVEELGVLGSGNVLEAIRDDMIGVAAALVLVAECNGQDLNQLLVHQRCLDDILEGIHFP